MGKAASEYISKELSWNKISQGTAGLYRDVLNEIPRRKRPGYQAEDFLATSGGVFDPLRIKIFPEIVMTNNVRPNLIISGVNKAGTTSLFMYLSAHPDICGSKIKETQYFLPLRYSAKELPPLENYLQYFDHCQGLRYVMEATAGYYYGGAPVTRAIKETLGNPKILLIFRDPITRLFSFFKFKKSKLELDQNLAFEDYIRQCEALPAAERVKRENNNYWGVEGGYYINYLADWFDVFGDDLKIVFFEHLVSNPKSVLVEICEWLGIEAENFTTSLTYSVENKTVNFKNRSLQEFALKANWKAEAFWRSHPRIKRFLRGVYYAINGVPHRDEISADTRGRLDELFRPHNRQLAVELSRRGYRDLPSWLEKELQTASS